MKAANNPKERVLKIFTAEGLVEESVISDESCYYTKKYFEQMTLEELARKNKKHKKILNTFKKS
ncbi:hypothetical protein [Alteromonas sp. a30]|uniref:hypothetical protein n=1 Tax=Alteromonas sp. a30 TaxID=2730917 RepID=UPI00227E1F4B|nr:hypothetical protein [Alteromonas sp. a30]MCY7297299.1 hypothetical protein [Alteromonas sp. a30]